MVVSGYTPEAKRRRAENLRAGFVARDKDQEWNSGLGATYPETGGEDSKEDAPKKPESPPMTLAERLRQARDEE